MSIWGGTDVSLNQASVLTLSSTPSPSPASSLSVNHSQNICRQYRKEAPYTVPGTEWGHMCCWCPVSFSHEAN